MSISSAQSGQVWSPLSLMVVLMNEKTPGPEQIRLVLHTIIKLSYQKPQIFDRTRNTSEIEVSLNTAQFLTNQSSNLNLSTNTETHRERGKKSNPSTEFLSVYHSVKQPLMDPFWLLTDWSGTSSSTSRSPPLLLFANAPLLWACCSTPHLATWRATRPLPPLIRTRVQHSKRRHKKKNGSSEPEGLATYSRSALQSNSENENLQQKRERIACLRWFCMWWSIYQSDSDSNRGRQRGSERGGRQERAQRAGGDEERRVVLRPVKTASLEKGGAGQGRKQTHR